MPETFNIPLGQITVDGATVTLELPNGRHCCWPIQDPLSKTAHDEHEQICAKVIQAILRRGYKSHPVVRWWIVRNVEMIAIYRSIAFPNSNMKIAQKHILAATGCRSLQAAKSVFKKRFGMRKDEAFLWNSVDKYKSREAVAAIREAELIGERKSAGESEPNDRWKRLAWRYRKKQQAKSAKDIPQGSLEPVWEAWQEALKKGYSEAKRSEYVIQQCVRKFHGVFIGDVGFYNDSFAAGIKEWVEIFEKARLEAKTNEDSRLTLPAIVGKHLIKEFSGRVRLSNIRRGRRTSRKNTTSRKSG
jgi:hypothetical protein